jgi:predicted nucleic acid-binding protein
LRVVCDSTVLIGLAKIGKLDLLKQIYEEVYIPKAVYTKVVSRGKGKPGVGEIVNALWIKKESVKERHTVSLNMNARFQHPISDVDKNYLCGSCIGYDF